MKYEYETKPYCEWMMMDAIKEYDEHMNSKADKIATKYGVPLQDLRKEYAKFKAQQNKGIVE